MKHTKKVSSTNRGPGFATNEDVVREETEQERNVCLQARLTNIETLFISCSIHLNTTNTELDESAKHLPARDFIRRSTDSDFDQQRVVVRLRKTSL